jgi:hypothetical protein
MKNDSMHCVAHFLFFLYVCAFAIKNLHIKIQKKKKKHIARPFNQKGRPGTFSGFQPSPNGSPNGFPNTIKTGPSYEKSSDPVGSAVRLIARIGGAQAVAVAAGARWVAGMGAWEADIRCFQAIWVQKSPFRV